MAYYHLILGWNDVALETADEAVGLAQKLGSPLWEMRARTSLGIARLYRGELSEAVELLGDVYDLACALGSAPDQAMVLYELGRANLLVGDLKAAGQALEELLSVADRGELREYQTRGCWLQGRLALAQADLDQSLEALEDAHARAEAIGARLILWRADSALGDVHRAAGRSAEANATYQRAWETLQAIAATLPDEESRERMLAVPSAAELRERIAAGE
jgi:tetratricopeptide (TPR) repeat protein